MLLFLFRMEMFLVRFQLYVNVSAWPMQKGTFTCLKLSWNCEPVHVITRTIVSSWYHVLCIWTLLYFFIFLPLPCIFSWPKIWSSMKEDVEKSVCWKNLSSEHRSIFSTCSLDRKGNGVVTVLKMCQSFLASKQHTLYPFVPVRGEQVTCIAIAVSKSPAMEIVTYT